jgi:protocatechuate 3,4-dioxygenase beta subunit
MNKREFLVSSGLLGVASMLPVSKLIAEERDKVNADCVLIPSETAGPFPLDLTDNTYYLRSDIREEMVGVPLNVRMKILGQNNCLPMENVRVNIWHCSKDGLYSGYNQQNNLGQSGKTYLRGYQLTDANGMVNFKTIFPGWYTGRITHIHFQVFVSSSYSAVSQFTFDIEKRNALLSSNSSIYTKGIDPLNYNQDNIFADGYQYQIASLELDTTTNEYNSYIEVTVKGDGKLGLGYQEMENAKQFTLSQNFPNPFATNTAIPLELKFDSKVLISLYTINGKKVADLINSSLQAGTHNIPCNFVELGLNPDSYLYQLEITNSNGTYRTCKMMTFSK